MDSAINASVIGDDCQCISLLLVCHLRALYEPCEYLMFLQYHINKIPVNLASNHRVRVWGP